jgi:hypothetical protein
MCLNVIVSCQDQKGKEMCKVETSFSKLFKSFPFQLLFLISTFLNHESERAF